MTTSLPLKADRAKLRPSARFPRGQLPESTAQGPAGLAPSSLRPPRRSARNTVVFQCNASTAAQVKLAADFTEWEKHSLDLRRSADGTWQIAVELPRGEYSYRFLVDNEWRDDPRCQDYEPNPFGGLNAVVRVT